MHRYLKPAASVAMFALAAVAIEAWATPSSMSDPLRLVVFGGTCCDSCNSRNVTCPSGTCAGTYKEFNAGANAGTQIVLAANGGGCSVSTPGSRCPKDEALGGTCTIPGSDPQNPDDKTRDPGIEMSGIVVGF